MEDLEIKPQYGSKTDFFLLSNYKNNPKTEYQKKALEDHLRLNPVYEAYKELEGGKKSHKASSMLDEALKTRNPEEGLLGLLRSDKAKASASFRLSIYENLYSVTKNKENRLEYARALHSMKPCREYLYLTGIAEYEAGLHKEAFRDFYKSMPASATYLAKCYFHGLGARKDEGMALAALIQGASAKSETALNELRRLDNIYHYESKSVRDTLANDHVRLTLDDKNDLLSAYNRDGYLSDANLPSALQGGIIKESAREFMKNYGVDIYETIEDIPGDALGQLVYFLKILESEDPEMGEPYKNTTGVPQYIRFYELDLEMAEFFQDTFLGAHTPSEAALFLDIPLADAERKYEKLLMYLRDHVRTSATLKNIYLYLHHDVTDVNEEGGYSLHATAEDLLSGAYLPEDDI